MALSNHLSTERSQNVDLLSDPRWQVAERAVRSSALKRAAQLQAILLYAVRHAILEPDEPLREYEIACAVLGRKSDFTPIDDNIVRVQVGHLRKKLEQYFVTEGQQEPIVILLERGSYTPVFRPREAVEALPPKSSLPQGAAGATEQDGVPHSRQRASASSRNGLRWVLVLSIGALLAASGWVIGRIRRPPEDTDRLASSNIANPILRRIFAPNTVVNVVVADTALVFLQNTIHSNISIAQYLDRSYPANILGQVTDPASQKLLSELAIHRYTSLDDADVVGLSFKWGSLLGAKPVNRYARDLHVRDFEQGNFVVIGSRRGNPWASLFDKDVNFVFEEIVSTHDFHFVNRKPAPGEPSTYEFTRQSDGESTGYVDIAILPNPTHAGSVLLINGFSMETNEAAANLIFRKDLPAELSQRIGTAKPNSKIEILMRVHNLDGSEKSSEIVAVRIDSDDPAR